MARFRRTRDDERRVAVIGLGRFGASLAIELVNQGVEVLAMDSDPALVQRYSDDLPNAAVIDSTDPQALRQLGVETFDHVIVCIGADLEASVLTTSVLADLEVPDIWAKALSRQHGSILTRVGAHHVVLPEHEMGERVAHLVIDRRLLDYAEFDHEFAMGKSSVPRDLVGLDLKSSRVRSTYGVTIVAIKKGDGAFEFAGVDTVVHEDDVLIVAGPRRAVERFADNE